MQKIKISRDFSSTPGARFRDDGDFSGEEFRDRFLLPPLRDTRGVEEIEIDLDGVEGYATSFLEEAFGGLVRLLGHGKWENRLRFVSLEDSLLEQEIRGYMREASGDDLGK